jgi:MFS family permease
MQQWLRSRIGQVPSLIALHFLVGFVFWYGIEKIFLANQLQIGPTGIATIVTLYTIVTLFLDVPASVIADRWGRRRMLVVAVICFIAANLVLGSAQSFFIYLVGTALWALYTVSYNGTFEAILFDSLKQEKREKMFQKVDALSRLFFMLGIAVSSFVSGFLADQLGLRSAYFLSIVPLILGLFALYIIHEPRVHHDDDDAEATMKKGYIAHLLHAFRTVWRSSQLRLITFAMIIMYFIQTPVYEFEQYVYIVLFKSPVLVGIFNGIGGFMLALGFLIAIKRTFNPRILLLVTATSITLLALLASNYSLFFVAFVFVGIALLENTLQTELQHATTSRTRASVTSAVYFAGNVLIIPFIFIFGAIAEHQSIWQAYLIDGIVVLALVCIYIFLQKRTAGKIVASNPRA